MKRVNREGPAVLGQLSYLSPLSPSQFAEEMQKPDTLVLDIREIVAFGGAHIQGSLNIAFRQAFPIWAGRVLEQYIRHGSAPRILLVSTTGDDVQKARTELLRIGQEKVVGVLARGFRSWVEAGRAVAQLPQMSIHHLLGHVATESKLQIVDVRSQEEWEEERIPGAIHIHVPDLEEEMARLDKNRPVATYCGSGYRASIAASQLMRRGFDQVFNVPGSMTAWKDADYPLEE